MIGKACVEADEREGEDERKQGRRRFEGGRDE